MAAAEELEGRIGQTAEACEALGVARSTLYRRRQPSVSKPKRRPRPHRALDETERAQGARCIALGAVRRQGTRPSVGDASGRGKLLLLGPYHVSDSGGATGRSENAGTNWPSALPQTGAVGRSAQPGLVLGHHEASCPVPVPKLGPFENRPQISSLDALDARIAKLESVLEESRRAGKRQADPSPRTSRNGTRRSPDASRGLSTGGRPSERSQFPDKTFEAPCPEQCPCGGKVGAEGSIDLYQVDIPPIQPETWKFVVGHGHCQECGRRVRGQHPLLISKAFEVGTVHFGPRLLAFAAFQKMICGVSYDKIRLGFEQMLGFPVARSTLCRAMQRLARRAKPTRDALVEALRASPVVYADETGWKQGGRRVWLWVFTNLRETVYEILPGRGFEQAASVLGKNYAGTLGVDGWAPYRCFKEATLQTCYNHLLHRCHELLETATRGAVRFPRLVKAILQHALALRDRRDAGEISPHGLRVAKGLLQAKMNRLLHGRFTNPANQRFAKHLRRYRDNLFVFLDRADVEATNYPAEQDIRIAVVNRKTCGGGNRTAKGAQAQSILMSVLQSCRHKGIRVFDIVTSILRAPDNTPGPLVNPER